MQWPQAISGAHHGDEAADEAEVREVVGVDGGSRVDLQAVVVFAGVLEEAVHGVEHLMGQQEEPFPAEGEERSRLNAAEGDGKKRRGRRMMRGRRPQVREAKCEGTCLCRLQSQEQQVV